MFYPQTKSAQIRTPLVIKYQRKRLALQSAVIVQPLSDEQIEDYLHSTGPSFVGVRTALSQKQALREMATTPLMLSVLLLTYRDVSTNDIIRQETDLERRVWTDYVARQVAEKGDHTRYQLQCTRTWLAFLAQQIQLHLQDIFYAEYMDIQWLASPQQRTLTSLTSLIPSLVIGVFVNLLVSTVMTTNATTAFLLQMGVLGGFVGGYLSLSRTAEATERGRPSRARITRHLRNAVLLGVLLAASFGLSLHPADSRVYDPGYFLSDWLRDACILGLGSLLSVWAFQVCVDRQAGQRTPLPFTRRRGGRLVTWMNMIRSLPHWQAAVLLGIGIGLSLGLHQGLHQGLSFGLGTGLITGLIVGLSVVLVDLVLAASLQTPRFAERIHWRWHLLFQRDHLRTAVIVAAMAFPLYGLSGGLSFGLTEGLIEGLSDGLGFGLAYWLLLGLYHGIQQEHLDDQNRFQFNQGIRRSLRNGLLVNMISTVIIGTMSVLRVGLIAGLNSGLGYGLDVGLTIGLSYGAGNGLSYGLSDGLSDGLRDGLESGLSYGLHYELISLISWLVVIWALSGGPTVLRHYAIRWLLACHRTFPFHAQAFLDDATTRILLRRVGGGYSFIHRRLQDYFADVDVPYLEE